MERLLHSSAILLICILVTTATGAHLPTAAFIKAYNKRMLPLSYKSAEAMFLTATNVTEYNSNVARKASKKLSDQRRFLNKFFKRINTTYDENATRRKLRLLRNRHYIASNAKVDQGLDHVRGIMGHIYHFAKTSIDAAKIKSYKIPSNCSTSEKRQYLRRIMETSTDPDELAYTWKVWRDSISPYMRSYYVKLVELSNIVARENKFVDAGYMKRMAYEVDNLESICEDLWVDIKPFYEELHAYVRYRLMSVYRELLVDGSLMPDHLLGNMWAMKWDRVYRFLAPYPGKVTRMYKTSL